jgi:hypothetical protein
MNDTGTKQATRIRAAIVLTAFFLTTAVVFAAESDLNSIPEPLRLDAVRLIEKGIREADALRLTHQFLELRAEQKTILSAYQVLMHTVDNGLPPEPVLNKAFEGTAKNVHPDLITAAMQKVMDRYQYAYQHVRKTLDVSQNRVQSLGNLAAESMAAGLRTESLNEIFAALHQRSETMRDDSAQRLFDATLLSARDMSRLGISNQLVTDTICEALKTGMDGEAMLQLRNRFMNRAGNDGSFKGGRSAGSGLGPSGSGSGSGGSSGGGGGGGGGGSK